MPFGHDIYREPQPEYLARGLELTKALLEALRDLAGALGAETWLVLIPTREQVEDARWRLTEAATSPGWVVRDRPQRALSDVARSLGIPVIDLLPALRAHEERGAHSYWRIDGHFNALGHEATAASVASALRSRVQRPAGDHRMP